MYRNRMSISVGRWSSILTAGGACCPTPRCARPACGERSANQSRGRKAASRDRIKASCRALCPTLDDICEARRAIAGSAIRTPLVRLNAPEIPAEIYLKLENLQPIGSFKIRGAANAMARLSKEALARGVLTASAGNMAQGVAFCA